MKGLMNGSLGATRSGDVFFFFCWDDDESRVRMKILEESQIQEMRRDLGFFIEDPTGRMQIGTWNNVRGSPLKSPPWVLLA
jgi:hypothetical protein